MQLEELRVKDLKRGYIKKAGAYECLECKRRFEAGQVYPVGESLLQAKAAVRAHLRQEHPARLLENGSKYNGLTENQRKLLALYAGGKTDKEAAAELGLAPSTVRHQKFVFREKAKQAKLYLAQYETVFAQERAAGQELIPVHDHARNLDQRYEITQSEQTKILHTVFESLEPLRLRAFPVKDKKKVVVLGQLAGLFAPGRQYTEGEVNRILEEVYPDYVTLRRYLVDYGFLRRTKSGDQYWLT